MGEASEFMIQIITVDHAVKEFYKDIWKAISINLSLGDAERIIKLFKKYCEKNIAFEP